MTMMASTPCSARYSAAGKIPFQAGSYPSGVSARTPTPRGIKRTPGYMIGPSNGTSSVANGTTRPMVISRAMVLALDQDRSGALRSLAFAHDAEPLGDFGIGLEQAAEIAAEAVLVELLVGLDVPQPAGIRRNLVGDHDAHHVVFPQAPA